MRSHKLFTYKKCLALATVLALGCICAPQSAFALRVTRFVAEGQSSISTDQVKDPVRASCVITITNVSEVPQRVRWEFTYKDSDSAALTMNNTSGTVLQPLGSGTSSADCTDGVSDTCTLTMDYAIVPANAPKTQSVRCQGTISVDNETAGTQGFVIASGTLTTFIEAKGGSGSVTGGTGVGTDAGNNTAAPTTATIVIGEGRPF
jgi:hypothetical protein